MRVFILLLLAIGVNAQSTITLTDADVKAFYGAIGHGAATTGARDNANVFFVTNTNDTGAGSFRQALTDADTNGGGYIIFRTGGLLTFSDNLYIGDENGANGNIYVAGQTAPGGGFAVRNDGVSGDGRRLWLRSSNIILRHIRSWGGDNNGNDCLTIGDTSGSRTTDLTDVVIDHCSFHWAEDENVAFTHYTTAGATTWETPKWYMRRVSFTNNIIGEQYGSGYGMILYGSGKTDISILRNLFINHQDRSPLSNGVGNEYELNNNLMHWNYEFGPFKGHPKQKLNIIGNVVTPSEPFNGDTFRLIDCSTANCPPSGESDYTGTQTYYTDNKDFTNVGNNADYNTNISTYLQGGEISAIASDYVELSSTAIVDVVLNNAGAGVGTLQGRDALDQQMAIDYANGEGRYTRSFGGTPPTLAAGTPYTDTDGDGLWDDYENQNGGLSITPGTKPVTATLVNGTVIDQSGVTAAIRYNHMDIMLGELAGDWTGGAAGGGGGSSTPDGVKNGTSGMLIAH